MIRKKHSVAVAFLMLITQSALAVTTLKIIDEQGEPVSNAVVSFPSGLASNSATHIATMDQVARQFVPRVLVINKGQSVSFPNSDEVRHHVYSFSAIKPFEIKLYKDSDEPPIKYDQAGIGVLGCNIHDSMIGYIYVTDNELAKVTSLTGEVVFDEPVPNKVSVWHANLSLQQTKRIDFEIDPNSNSHTIRVKLVKKRSEGKTFGSRKFGKKS